MNFTEPIKILLGITGSISAYKIPSLVRLLRKEKWEVKIVLSDSAKHFVSPLSLKSISDNQVYLKDSFESEEAPSLLHIELARWADIILIAPASANTIAKIRCGIADNLLTSVLLASSQPLFIAPSMNRLMWENQATQENIQKLKMRGITFLGPDSGSQACGEEGEGRLLEPEKIVKALQEFRKEKENPIWKNQHFLITAGPTQEPIDPVRFICNRSSGKMGYALAQAALSMGAKVTLVSGETNLTPPKGAKFIKALTANEMLESVLKEVSQCHIFIGVAAVADWRVESLSKSKIKEKKNSFSLNLVPNPDIIATVANQSPRPFVVGFSAETENLREEAQKKRIRKKMDIILANDVSRKDIGFSQEENEILLIHEKGEILLPKESKEHLAKKILIDIYKIYKESL